MEPDYSYAANWVQLNYPTRTIETTVTKLADYLSQFPAWTFDENDRREVMGVDMRDGWNGYSDYGRPTFTEDWLSDVSPEVWEGFGRWMRAGQVKELIAAVAA